jgi:hypothetical protein
MTIRKRVAALEARASEGELSLAVRAWLGERLTPAERDQAASEAAQPVEIDWSKVSREARAWLAA